MRFIRSTAASLKHTALASTAVALALAVGGAAAHAAPTDVTFDPGVFAPGTASFTADKLNLLNFARVDVGTTSGGLTRFNEFGYLQVNNASLDNATFNPEGNRTDYSLYVAFAGTGVQSAPNFTGGSQGRFDTLTYTLIGATGPVSFGIGEDNSPYATTTGTSTTLATGSLISGTTTFSTAPLGAGANIDATFIEALAGFITSPTSATLTIAGAFNNNSNIVSVLNGGTAFTLNGGGGDLTFGTETTPIPEPATVALLGAGLIGLGVIGRRRPSA